MFTNFDTSSNITENMEYWKQTIKTSTQNIMSIAKQSLANNPSLLKVVIMKRMPRYDSLKVDPQGIKSYLSDYGNSVYNSEWEELGCPSNIVIAESGLDCYGALKDKRYGSVDAPYFDGIHLNGELGMAHYTGRVVKIFKLAFPHLQKVPSYKP